MSAKVPVRNPWVLPPPTPPAAQPPAPIVAEGTLLSPPGALDGGGIPGDAPPAAPRQPAQGARAGRKEVPGRNQAPSPKDPGRRPFTIYLDPPDFGLLERERQRRAIGSGRRRGYAEYSAIISAALRAYLSSQT